MFADPATGAEFWVHVGKLQTDLDVDGTPRRWRCLPWQVRINPQGTVRIIDDSAAVARPAGDHAVVIPRGELAWLEPSPLQLNGHGIGPFRPQHPAPDRTEVFPREDGLWAGGAILLADDTRPVHGPG